MHDNQGVKFILVSEPTVAKELISSENPPQITIEAEYGSYVAEGSLYTAAHHQASGPYSDSTNSPCCDTNIPIIDSGTVLLSHIDLDSIGGSLRTVELDSFINCDKAQSLFSKDNENFWSFAGFIDINGPHMMTKYLNATEDQKLIDQITAFWAWKEANIPHLRSPEGEATDVTSYIKSSANALAHILNMNPEYIEAGKTWQAKEADLASETFRKMYRLNLDNDQVFNVIFRESTAFANHLYTYSEGENTVYADAIICYNPNYGSITLSYAQWEDKKLDELIAPAYEIMQSVWGETAGGHAGIAGSPREDKVDPSMVETVFNTLKSYRANYLYETTRDEDIPF